MRRSTLKRASLALFIAAFGYCIPAQAQSATEELILQSPGVHAERNLNSIITELESLGGIDYLGFCENQNIIMLSIDRKIQPGNKPILEAFTQKNLEIHVKTEATVSQVTAICPRLVLPSTDPTVDPNSSSPSPE